MKGPIITKSSWELFDNLVGPDMKEISAETRTTIKIEEKLFVDLEKAVGSSIVDVLKKYKNIPPSVVNFTLAAALSAVIGKTANMFLHMNKDKHPGLVDAVATIESKIAMSTVYRLIAECKPLDLH